MAVISQETWNKFTKEEKDKLISMYNDEKICRDKSSVWWMLSTLFGDVLKQTEIIEKEPLSKEKQEKIIAYCQNKLNEVKTYLSNAKSITDVESLENDFAEAYMNDIEEISHDVATFSLVFDRIMLFGYVTPFGVTFDTNVSYNNGNEIYNVDINAKTIS